MKNLVLMLPILALAACSSPPPPPVVEAPRARGLAQGIDLPTDARDVSQELKGSRLDFVARYYRDPASRWPTLSAAEARMVSAAGMRLVAVWEWHSHRPDYFTQASGYADAIAALPASQGDRPAARQRDLFRGRFQRPGGGHQGPVDQYFRGVAAGLRAAARGHRSTGSGFTAPAPSAIT